MYYFASDIHLGLDCSGSSAQREKLFIEWLEYASSNAEAIFLVGDVFDFWFEYKRVIPRGFSRLLGKLSELTDRGVEIHFFVGNHDMWAFDYLSDECGLILHRRSALFTLYDKRVFISHGDAMWIKNRPLVKLMNWGFRSRGVQNIFSVLLHPNLAMRFGQWWSGTSRGAKSISHKFRGEGEPLVCFARDYIRTIPVDYFVFGHIHCAEDYSLGHDHRAIFLGEWLESPTYAVLDKDGKITLKKWDVRA